MTMIFRILKNIIDNAQLKTLGPTTRIFCVKVRCTTYVMSEIHSSILTPKLNIQNKEILLYANLHSSFLPTGNLIRHTVYHSKP